MRRFSFGGAPDIEGYETVGAETGFLAERGFGWLAGADLLMRDRGRPAEGALRSLILSFAPATFRVACEPGRYRLRIAVGDTDFANHETRITASGSAEAPVFAGLWSQYAEIELDAVALTEWVDIAFDSPVGNWIVNALSLEPSTVPRPATVRARWIPSDRWSLPAEGERGPGPLIARWRASAAAAAAPTGLTRRDYLTTVARAVRAFLPHQREDGAIVDAYLGIEFQYATPCFAYAAALVATEAAEPDLLEPAARAFDWASRTLAAREAASAHEDFFPSPLAHAFRLLSPRVAPARRAIWRKTLRGMDPFRTYRVRAGGHDGPGSNWNCVALAGEYLLHAAGLRADTRFVVHSLMEQGRFFGNAFGMYAEGPMAYDAFPRAWLADMMAEGYDSPAAESLREALRRGALTSLLLQSSNGELPCGGRSAHHQWVDALQAVIFEHAAAWTLQEGDIHLAGTFKRAARRALAAILPWRRASGELWVVKNRADLAARHGFESYSSHSHYNLLTLAALGYAYERAATSEHVAERLTPAETGGFVVVLPPPFHKIVASAAGTHILVATSPDPGQTPAGLVRIHFRDMKSAIGPSDGLVRDSGYHLPDGPRCNASAGLGWPSADGKISSLADLSADRMAASCEVLQESPDCVRFRVTWALDTEGPARIVETYTLRSDELRIDYQAPGWSGDLALRWPVFVGDGASKADTETFGSSVVTTFGSERVSHTARGTGSAALSAEVYPHRNGFCRLVGAKARNGEALSLVVRRLR